MRVTRSARETHAVLISAMRGQHGLEPRREGVEGQRAKGDHEFEVGLGPPVPAVRARAADQVEVAHEVGVCGISTMSAFASTPSTICWNCSRARMAPMFMLASPAAFSA